MSKRIEVTIICDSGFSKDCDQEICIYDYDQKEYFRDSLWHRVSDDEHYCFECWQEINKNPEQ